MLSFLATFLFRLGHNFINIANNAERIQGAVVPGWVLLNVFAELNTSYMKKMRLLVVACATFAATNASAQGAGQGNFIIDPYYGAPNIGKSIFQNIKNEAGTTNFRASGLGPMGVRAEYMVADRIGVGFDVIYNSTTARYIQSDTTYNSGTYTYTTNEYKRTMQRLRVQLRFNYHFDISTPNLDAYFGVGAGTNNRFRKLYTNGKEDNDDIDLDLGNFTVIPFSMRICTGMRYYFTENIGMNAEIGLGGPLISAGLSFRF